MFVAIGRDDGGAKEVLRLWTSATEGAKLWLQILTEIRNRAVADILIACVDGFKGFPEAITTVYPRDDSRNRNGGTRGFEERRNTKYAAIGKLWRRHWAGISPQFPYPEEIRRAIYSTNVVESLHMTVRKVIKTPSSLSK